LSNDTFQERLIREDENALAVRPVGIEGGVVSGRSGFAKPDASFEQGLSAPSLFIAVTWTK
jgi:hypothetical protein